MRRRLRYAAAAWLLLIVAALAAAGWLAPEGYAAQHREFPSSAPSARFPLGTDELGRDLFARTLYGGRVSLLLAAAAAALATSVAAVVGIAAGFGGGVGRMVLDRAGSLLLSLPWLFLLLAVRAALPLDAGPQRSAWLTFLILGMLGWAAPAQVMARSAAALRRSAFTLRARAEGSGPWRIVLFQLAPNLWPVIRTQFLILLPGFILTEATLSFLGLGVAEPLPSWGGLLRGLEDYTLVAGRPWKLAPLVLLVLVAGSLQSVTSREVRNE